jgi:hypothetical protein
VSWTASHRAAPSAGDNDPYSPQFPPGWASLCLEVNEFSLLQEPSPIKRHCVAWSAYRRTPRRMSAAYPSRRNAGVKASRERCSRDSRPSCATSATTQRSSSISGRTQGRARCTSIRVGGWCAQTSLTRLSPTLLREDPLLTRHGGGDGRRSGAPEPACRHPIVPNADSFAQRAVAGTVRARRGYYVRIGVDLRGLDGGRLHVVSMTTLGAVRELRTEGGTQRMQ